jgi:general secretion pathway protein D
MLDIDIQLDNKTAETRLNFTATNRSLVSILESLCNVLKLRYRISGQSLFLEEDTPFNKNYNVQFLNLTRLSKNNISSLTDIFAGGTSQQGLRMKKINLAEGEGNGSNTSIKMSNENDFWNEVEINLRTLLSDGSGRTASAEWCDRHIYDDDSPFSDKPSHKHSRKKKKKKRKKFKNKYSDGGRGPVIFTGERSRRSEAAAAKFTIHRQAGIISVWGTTEQHHRVAEYLDMLQKAATSQVLIEAKVIEVNLNEEFRNGIEWGSLGAPVENGFNLSFGESMDAQSQSTETQNSYLKIISGFKEGAYGVYGLQWFLKNLQKFGSTKTLSSPRLTVMNNQTAVLKVAQNYVYFKLNYNKHFYSKTSQSELAMGSDIQTVPIGFVMSVQPAIDPVRKSVILFLRPTISKLERGVSDPSIAVMCGLQGSSSTATEQTTIPKSEVPVVEVREIDSVLRLKDGEVAVLGGLMETKAVKNKHKNPVFKKVPVVKNLFAGASQREEVSEIVILIRVKILDVPSPDDADERLVHLYAADPRPLL